MLDKRDLANEELRKNFDGGLVSLSPQQSETFSDLSTNPSEEQQPSGGGGGDVYNNFNVNVSVNKTNTTVSPTATKVIENAFPVTSEIPELLKKNSPIESIENLKNERSFEQLRGIGDQESPPPNLVEIQKEADRMTPSVSLLHLAGTDMTPLVDASNYEYSDSNTKNQNPDIVNRTEVLKNIVQQSVVEHEVNNVLPSNARDSAIYLNYNNHLRSTYETKNLNIEQNTQSPVDQANQAVRHQQQIINSQTEEINRTVNLVAKDGEIRRTEMDDINESKQVNSKPGAGPAQTVSKKPRGSNNLNPVPSTIPLFVNKMNSPPVWRTVLG